MLRSSPASKEFRRKAGASENLTTPSLAGQSGGFELPMHRAVRNAH